jgi:RNA polymerase sigma-70 factor (ECF subfamily)
MGRKILWVGGRNERWQFDVWVEQGMLAGMDEDGHKTRDLHGAIEAVWKAESTRLIAGIARVTRDVGLAEELAQDALVAALERWPEEGIPEKPGAWLMTAAKRRAIDTLRRGRMLELKHGEITRELEYQQQRLGLAMDQALDQVIDDDVLRLIFTACHPVVAVEGRIALTLRLVGGLTTAEIARAFLVPEKTVGQRIFRAKKTLAEAHVPFELPRGEELRGRVASVLSVIYLIFNEGYAATSGDEWMREELCKDALRLGRVLAELLPGEAEIYGLLALMELQASRTVARRGPGGEAVLLPEQDRSLWDSAQIERGMDALYRAQALGGGSGAYALQAAIVACHARARVAEETDWERIVVLYDALLQVSGSPIVGLNRAVAVGMAQGPAAGLEALDALAGEAALAKYPLLPSVRGDLLVKLGRYGEAREELGRAIAMTENVRERELLSKKLKQATVSDQDKKSFGGL